MFLQSYLYYQLRAIHEIVVHPEDCLDFTPSSDLFQVAVNTALDTAECLYLNLLALTGEASADSVFSVLHQTVGLLHAIKSRLAAGSQSEILLPLICFLEDDGFQILEQAGYPDPERVGATCLRIEGCGYVQSLIPSVCASTPSQAMGFYTNWERAAVQLYMKSSGVLCSLIPVGELEEDHALGCCDWVMSHVCAFTTEYTYRVRGQIFAQLWSRELKTRPA